MTTRVWMPLVTALVAVGLILLIFLQPASSEGKTIEILCQKSFYTPDRIVLKKGEPVKLVLRSKDVTHGFAVDEWGIALEVPPGPPVTVTIRPKTSGEFTFYCVVRCGKNHLQMRGTFIVQ